MHFLDAKLNEYLDAFASHEDPVLAEMAALAREREFPFVGPQVGSILGWLTRSIEAKRVLELGSGFGYSAWWFAHAVARRGYVILTENDRQNVKLAKEFLDRAGLGDRVRIEKGDALQTLARLDGPFDVIFNDIDKSSYGSVLELAADRLRVGGLFISDNMLWDGKVLEPSSSDAETQGVLKLTHQLQQDPRFDPILLPVRDGLTIARRVEPDSTQA